MAIFTYALTVTHINKAYLWNLRTGQIIRVFNKDRYNFVSSVAISPCGRYTLTGSATGNFDSVELGDLFTGKAIKIFKGHTEWVDSVAISPDGNYALTGSWDGTARVWDINYWNKQDLKTIIDKIVQKHQFQASRAKYNRDLNNALDQHNLSNVIENKKCSIM